jgi:hypothetical protein
MSPVHKPEMTEANLAAGARDSGLATRDSGAGVRNTELGTNCWLSAVSCQLQEDSSLQPILAAPEYGQQVRTMGDLALEMLKMKPDYLVCSGE